MNSFEEVSQFFRILYPPSPKITFQSFSKKDPSIKAQIFHGTLEENWSKLKELNSKRSDIYAMVNTGNGSGRDNHSVVSIENLLLDLDGSSPEPVLSCPIKPHVILGTSSGRFQGRWKIEPIHITPETRNENRMLFKRVQIGLAEKFSGDPSVCDLARVARVPQFLNYNHGKPFLVKTLQINDSPVLSIRELSEALDLNLTNPYSRNENKQVVSKVNISSKEPIYEGTRNITLFFICRYLAYQDVLGDDLLDQALEINQNRCIPPLDDDEVRSIAYSVSGYWYANSKTVEECLTNILERNPDLKTFRGSFYRYGTKTRKYRILQTNTFHNDIFQMSKRTASRHFIDEVMNELCSRILTGLPAITPEAKFIEEHICEGGKAILEDIRREYKRWCQKKGILPLRRGLAREIEFRMGLKRKRIKINGKNYYGFQGICLKQ